MRSAVFIDMQGTLGGSGMDDASNFSFYSFAPEAIRLLNENNILAIVTTNQSRIGKGYLTLEDFNNKVEELKIELLKEGAILDGVYCCPHVKGDKCLCKKPLKGLIEQAQKELDIDLEKSFVIGDMGISDIVMAKNIGAKGILVLTGCGQESLREYRHTWSEYEADFVADNVLEGVRWILEQGEFIYDGE